MTFTVCRFVEGRSYSTQEDVSALGDDGLVAVVGDIVASLAELHRVDHFAVGLETLGRPDAYAARQLRRWRGQWQIVGPAELGALAAQVMGAREHAAPEQRRAAIVHGDYRIDNTLVSGDGQSVRVTAIVGWELSTIGDPIGDVAMMCAYRDPAFDLIMGSPSAWTSGRLPAPGALADAYVAASGHDLENWRFHRALAYFKVAVIAAGIDHRRRAGSGSGTGFDTAGDSVPRFLDLADRAIARPGVTD